MSTGNNGNGGPPRFRGRGRWGFRGRFKPYGRGGAGSSGGPGRNFGASQSGNGDSQNQVSIPDYAPNAPRRPRQTTIETQYSRSLKSRYPGYSLYFGNSLPIIQDPWQKLEFVNELFERNEAFARALKFLNAQEYFDLSYEDLVGDGVFLEQWPTFTDELDDIPEEVLHIFGLAIHNMVQQNVSPSSSQRSEATTADPSNSAFNDCIVSLAPRIQARLMRSEPLTPLKSIKSSLVGKFITIRGAVVRTGNIRPFCTQMAFKCSDCRGIFVNSMQAGMCTLPSHCSANPDCTGKVFEPLESSKLTKHIDERKIRVQDIQYNDAERGSVPRSIECYLYNDIADLCSAGDAVTMSGIVKMCKENTSLFGSNDRSLHNCYLDVVAVRNHKDSERTMGGNWFSFTNKDYYAVMEIHDTPDLFRLLVASLCPTIYGHDIVKAGVLLSMFGGTSNDMDPVLSQRSEINVLIVGDPGLGKSQILNVVSEVAPRGVYVCGTSSTIAGLTVTMVKDGDEYSLEAGALVMADRGVCCIDEFDKMQSQHNALLEAMEQQCISVAKSGVFRTLSARTAVIAAANPVGGHYDKAKTVSENIRINPALLSRFDLTFILLDTPEEERDRNIVHHVMGLRGSFASQKSTTSSISTPRSRNMPLVERLKFDDGEVVDLISHHLIRKYIAYAKLYAKPKLSPEAKAVLKEYYLHLRTKHRHIQSTPVTARQLQSLMRLAQARAKLELREVVTADDAKDALEIFEFGLSDVFDNDLLVNTVISQMSTSIGTPSSRTGTKNMAKKLVGSLQTLSTQQSKNIFTLDEIKQVARALGISSTIDNIVSSLNNEGLLLHKGGRTYQLQSGDF